MDPVAIHARWTPAGEALLGPVIALVFLPSQARMETEHPTEATELDLEVARA